MANEICRLYSKSALNNSLEGSLQLQSLEAKDELQAVAMNWQKLECRKYQVPTFINGIYNAI